VRQNAAVSTGYWRNVGDSSTRSLQSALALYLQTITVTCCHMKQGPVQCSRAAIKL